MSHHDYRELQRQWRAEVKALQRTWRRRDSIEMFAARPVEERIRIFRRSLAGAGATTAFLFVINMMTSPFFPWFIFPAIGMGVGVMRQWGSLWADGVSWRQMFGRQPIARPAGAALSPVPPADEAAELAPRDVLDGPHGAAVRNAVADRRAILGIVEGLSKEDRALLPEIAPTVDALVKRTASLAQMLHRLDIDASAEMIARLEMRIADVEREPESAVDRERRLALLRRQRDTMRDLAERRAKVAGQLDSAVLTLQNLRLDLVRLRSSGVGAALEDVTMATREARALSKEIGHVLDAAAEVKAL
jgi:serine/threonine-protein kinase